MTVLAESAVEPSLETRRSRRLAAQRAHARHAALVAPVEPSVEVQPAAEVAEQAVVPVVAEPAPAVTAADLAPVTATELVAAAERASERAAAEIAAAEQIVTAEQPVVVVEETEPVREVVVVEDESEEELVAVTVAAATAETPEPAAEAPGPVRETTSAPTRRELREQARRAAMLAESDAATCHDVPVAGEVTVAEPADEADVPESDYELASVALTLSRLAVAATVFSAEVAAEAETEAETETPEVAGAAAAPEQPTAAAAVTPASEDVTAAAAMDVDSPDTVPLRRVRQRERRAATPLVPAVPRAASTTLTAPIVPLPSSAGGSSVPTAAATSGGARQWAPRVAVLSALGAATVLAPVVAVARTAEEPVVPAPLLAEASALDTFAAAPGATDEPATRAAEAAMVGDTAEILAGDQLAELRSTVSASRSDERNGLPQCGEPSADAPNGVLAALESSTEYVSLSMPLQEGVYRITSVFGPRWGTTHLGLDMAAPTGTPIHAIADGTVVHAGGGKDGRSGMLVIIQSEIDGEIVEFWNVHMYPNGVFVSEGDTVRVGDVIGEVGSYGNSTGPHLHLEIHTGDLSNSVTSAVDPQAWLAEHNATPVTSSVVCS